MNADTAISIRNLTKTYQLYQRPVDRLKQLIFRNKRKYYTDFPAISDISLDIAKGETVGVVGANGSGKSTLLKLICNIVRPTVGEVSVKGRVAALLELGAGFNPQFTGRENIKLSASLMGLSQKELQDRFDQIIAFADIGPFIDQPVHTYSSGMFVRLAFSAAIHVSPDILLIDEALAVGDIRFRQKCMERIKQFCKQGTVLFVSHDASAIAELCSRAIWIKGGYKVMDGQPKAVLERYHEEMYAEKQGDTLAPSNQRSPSLEMADLPSSGKTKITTKDYVELPRDANAFGDGRATITKIRLSADSAYNQLFCGGQSCNIDMLVKVNGKILRPIVGCLLKDRLGRIIFGENSDGLKVSTSSMQAGQWYRVEFAFPRWPQIAQGQYSLSLAIGDGTWEDHAMCHWVHDAVALDCIPARRVTGIVGVEDLTIAFDEVMI